MKDYYLASHRRGIEQLGESKSKDLVFVTEGPCINPMPSPF